MPTLEVDPNVYAEFEYMVQLYQRHGAPSGLDSVERLISFVLASVADGSRRPGSWERGLLEPMGLVADCPEHQQYREKYGSPTEASYER